jgi:lysophospholipase L1-like esterase
MVAVLISCPFTVLGGMALAIRAIRTLAPWSLTLVLAAVLLYAERRTVSASFGFSTTELRSAVGLGEPRTEFDDRMAVVHQRLDPTVPDDAFLFFGNSLIHSLYVTAVTPNAVNFGVGGDTTTFMLRRMDTYKSINRARGIFLEIGINDLFGRDPSAIIESYAAVLKRFPDRLPVYVSQILPVDPDGLVDALKSRLTKQRRDELSAAIRNLCDQRRNCIFVGTDKLADASGALRTAYHVGDGLHLNVAGYKAWAEIISAAINHP